MVIQADNKIVIEGGAYNPQAHCSDLVLARYTANGLLDTTFGPDETGTVMPNVLTGPADIVIQPDGRIVATWACGMSGSGSVLARYMPGKLDRR